MKTQTRRQPDGRTTITVDGTMASRVALVGAIVFAAGLLDPIRLLRQ